MSTAGSRFTVCSANGKGGGEFMGGGGLPARGKMEHIKKESLQT